MDGIWTKSLSNAQKKVLALARSRSAWLLSRKNTTEATGQRSSQAPAGAIDEALWRGSQTVITDKLRSYGAAKADVAPCLDYWSHKDLTIVHKTAIGRFENGNEHCRATGRRERYKGSSQCTPLSAIAFQFHPAAARRQQFATTASKRSMFGELRPPPPESFGAGTVAPLEKPNVTTHFHFITQAHSV